MLVSPYNKPKIIPPAEHPRLLFCERDRARIEAGQGHHLAALGGLRASLPCPHGDHGCKNVR